MLIVMWVSERSEHVTMKTQMWEEEITVIRSSGKYFEERATQAGLNEKSLLILWWLTGRLKSTKMKSKGVKLHEHSHSTTAIQQETMN